METIGDAYCVASGITNQNKNGHVRNIATVQREFLKTFEIPHRPGNHLHCRWGFNTGPDFTEVVGIRAPIYSVFGESVLIKSKMENLGIPDHTRLAKLSEDKVFVLSRLVNNPEIVLLIRSHTTISLIISVEPLIKG